MIKKIDYDSLELMLYQNRISDYHDLVDKINLWSVNLGFLMKLRRPPKMNADGSKTMRVYCSSQKKESDEKCAESKKDVKNPESDAKFKECTNCPFALTFKLEERQGQWLLYQEYSQSSMTHNHTLDKLKYQSIRDYIGQYTIQIKSLSELKDLIFAKFGLEYSLNQIHYFQGQWQQESMIQNSGRNEEPSSDDTINFVRLLKKYRDDHLFVEYDKSKKGGIDTVFYSSLRMKETYLRNNDILFINKRLAANRFGKSLVLFLTVSSTGRSNVVAVALIE